MKCLCPALRGPTDSAPAAAVAEIWDRTELVLYSMDFSQSSVMDQCGASHM